jgi:tetratricopeptide (TPR) repeat protein
VLKWLLLFLIPLYLNALEISFQAGKENFDKYTLLHVKANAPFICEPQTDDFNNITKVICAFSTKPEQSLKPLSDDFFSVVSEIKKGTFFLIVTPTHKMKLLPDVFDAVNENTFFKSKVRLSKSWVMVGYKEKFSLLSDKKSSEKSLNLPITFPKNEPLYVGSLDIQGNPVHIKQAGDVSGYLKAKKSFEKEDYAGTVQAIDDIIKSFPDSIFMSEMLYYKIKALSKLKKYDDVIALSKQYLRAFASDENVPEVLSLTAMGYGKIGQNSDADYFYDRLFSEHSDSVFSKKGMIYKGDQLLEAGDAKKALEYYQRALDETSDIDTAATASQRIANFYLSGASPKKAQNYVDKILQADPAYFLKDRADSLKFASTLADKGMFLEASKVSQILLAPLKKQDENYELLLNNSGVWLAKTGDKADAMKLLNRYLKEFPHGTYTDIVKTTKDSLFFDVNDGNISANMTNYDKLIKNYKNDSIGQKALYKKAQLLLQSQRYADVLAIKTALRALDRKIYPNVDSMISQAAGALMKTKLKDGKCNEVVSISNEYAIKLSSDFDDDLYNCYMKIPQLTLAKNMAAININTKTLTLRMKWMYRYANVSFVTGDYKNAIKMGNDVITLIGRDKKSPYIDIFRTLFDAYQRVGDDNKMIAMMTKIVDLFGENFKDIERYVQMMGLGTRMKDDNIIITYGDKVMNLQSKTSTYTESPYAEFTTYQAYMNKGNFTRALTILYSLDKRALNKEQRARQKYLLGALLQKKAKNSEAKAEFKKSIAASKDSPWAKLASDAMKLL